MTCSGILWTNEISFERRKIDEYESAQTELIDSSEFNRSWKEGLQELPFPIDIIHLVSL